MKIKVIDLLNMITRGEEVPKKIKYGEKIWFYEGYNYIDKDLNPDFIDSNKRYLLGTYNFLILNNEVEIIEAKPKEIEKLNKDGTFIDGGINHQSIINMQNKLNELIDKVNEMSKDD